MRYERRSPISHAIQAASQVSNQILEFAESEVACLWDSCILWNSRTLFII